MSTVLTQDQLSQGEQDTREGKLTPSQISDLVSIFRGYLGSLADNYPLASTFAAQDDTVDPSMKCAKLAACLLLFQENQFTPTSGFAPTVSNRTGFNYSADEEVYKIFEYAFGLFWPVPDELKSKTTSNRHVSTQGVFKRRNP